MDGVDGWMEEEGNGEGRKRREEEKAGRRRRHCAVLCVPPGSTSELWTHPSGCLRPCYGRLPLAPQKNSRHSYWCETT